MLINQKKYFFIVFNIFLSLLSLQVSAVDFIVSEVSVTDSSDTQRTQFSSTEPVNLFVKIINTKLIARIDFSFSIKDPTGKSVLTQSGNSIVGQIGEGGASLKNLPMAFYTIPGTYTFTATATSSDGSSDSKSTTFDITSPFITLFYPPKNSRDLTDNPLTFRWIGSGATRYLVSVDTSSGFADPVWQDMTFSGDISYPDNPSNPRQKLNAGTVYWWKVTGLDANGNPVATTQTPFNFSVKAGSQATTTRDLDVKSFGFLDWTGTVSDKIAAPVGHDLKVMVQIENKGNTTETNVPVRLFMDSRQIGEPQMLDVLSVAAVKNVEFSYKFQPQRPGPFVIPSSALLDFKDDSDRNNLMTKPLRIEIETTDLSGRVLAQDAPNDPLAGVMVAYEGPLAKGEVKCDVMGHYRISGLPIGEGMSYKLAFKNPPRYKEFQKTVPLLEKNPAPFDVTLEPMAPLVTITQEPKRQEPTAMPTLEASLEGKVVDGDGKPIPDAVVSFEGPAKGEVRTDEKGAYLISKLPLGVYRVKSSKTGFDAPDPIEAKLKESRAYSDLNFRLIAKAAAAAEPAFTKQDAWKILRDYIKHRKDFMDAIKGYELEDIESVMDIKELIQNLKAGKTALWGARMVNE